MQFAIDRDILVSCDSLSQLRQYGSLNPGGRAVVRFNPGVGAGHHEKVVTGGKNTKFGVNIELIDEVKAILQEYNLKLVGINQHIGSLFMEGTPYIEGVKSLLAIAAKFPDLEFVDMGGGFGIPYHKQEGQERLDLTETGRRLTEVIESWMDKYGRRIRIKMEPGRYVVAECGVLLGTVHSVKYNGNKKYIGTDIGFNVLIRPAMYDSHHDIEMYRNDSIIKSEKTEPVTVVGNICETGDILAKDRELPEVKEGDLIGIMDAGAYGYSMASNYNNRLRPAEVLIGLDGNPRLIRRRDTFED
jgi:diaminopimelate decarboxylase